MGWRKLYLFFRLIFNLAKDAVSSNKPIMKFIGVVKTGTKEFLILYLSNIYLDNNGYFRSDLLNNDIYGVDKLFMLVCINQYIIYFLQHLRKLLKGYDTWDFDGWRCIRRTTYTQSGLNSQWYNHNLLSYTKIRVPRPTKLFIVDNIIDSLEENLELWNGNIN